MTSPDPRRGERPRWDLAVLYAVAVAGYPLVAGIPVALNLDNRLITVPYRAVVLGLSIYSLAITARRREFYTGVLWYPLGLFWLLYIARMLSDTLIFPVELGQPRGEYFLYGIGTSLIPMLSLMARPSDATLRKALRLTTVVAAVAATAVLYLGLKTLLSGDIMGIASGRFELFTLNSISIGHLGASLTTLALFQLRSREVRVRGGGVFLTLAVVVGVVCVGVAASKGPLLVLMVNVALLQFVDWRQGHRARAIFGAVVAPAIAIPLALYFEQELGFGVITRLQAALQDPGTESIRLDLLASARDQFLANFFTGSSLDEREMLTYPHNTFVEAFMAVGIVGGLAYTCFHLGSIQRGLRLVSARPDVAWVGMLCAQYTVAVLFSGSLYYSSVTWAMLAAAIAVAADRLRQADPVTSTVGPDYRPIDGAPSPA